eukprot:351175-Chlamydomonas_euryale.AAC.2
MDGMDGWMGVVVVVAGACTGELAADHLARFHTFSGSSSEISSVGVTRASCPHSSSKFVVCAAVVSGDREP